MRGIFFYVAAIAVLSAALFVPAQRAFFVADDFEFLSTAKSALANPSSIPHLLITNHAGNRDGGSYRPLMTLSIIADLAFFGPSPLSFHLTSLFLHLLVVFLVGLLSWRLFKSHQVGITLLAVIFFSTAHFHAEPVLWIGSRADLLATAFLLAAAISFLAFLKTGRVRAGLLTLFFTALALMSKEFAITAPLIFLILAAWQKKESLRERRVWLIISGAVALVIGFFFVRAYATGFFAANYLHEPLTITSLALKGWNFLFAALPMFFVGGRWRTATTLFFLDHLWLAVALAVVILVWLIMLLRRRQDAGWLMLLTIISAAPAAAFFTINTFRGAVDDGGERYLYYPSVWFVLWLATAVINWWSSAGKKMRLALMVLIIIFIVGNSFLLLRKARWHARAGISVQKMLVSYAEQKSTKPHGEIFLWLPDNYNGAHLLSHPFFKLATQFLYDDDQADTIFVPVNIALTADQDRVKNFTFTQASSGFIFTANQGYPFRGPEFLESEDYILKLTDLVGARARRYEIQMTKNFWRTNRDKEIQYFLFDGGEFLHLTDPPGGRYTE
ncbi:MAG: hypothetical protein HW383_404 [Candidatus Magasanikbacteria bacterium]|nr:hypothetical protein [Candidatus Magasanikbacteria bacterium]